MYHNPQATTVSSHSHDEEVDSDRGLENAYLPDPRTTLNKLHVVSAGSRDIGSSAPGPVSSRTRRKLTQGLRDGRQVSLSAEVHASEESSDEEEFEQAVTVSRQSERMDRVDQCSGADGEAVVAISKDIITNL